MDDAEVDSTEKAVDKIGRIKRVLGGTATTLALYMVHKDVVPLARKNSKRILLFITDGMSNIGGRPKSAAKRLKEKDGFEIYAIGVGRKVNLRELNDIASDPEDGADAVENEHVIKVPDYQTLQKALKKAVEIKIGKTQFLHTALPITTHNLTGEVCL